MRRCSLTLNKLVSRGHPGTLHAQRFRGCALKTLATILNAFGRPIWRECRLGCVLGQFFLFFSFFLAQTSPSSPPKNHHYSASLRLINPRRSDRLFIAEGRRRTNPPFPSPLPLLIPICLKIEIAISSKKTLLNSRKDGFHWSPDEQNPEVWIRLKHPR